MMPISICTLAGMLLFSGAAAYLFLFAAAREKYHARLTALPRHKIAGTILGAWIIFSCVPHVAQLLEGTVFASLPLLLVFAIFFTVLVWKYVDYHFARGMAAVLIYMAYLLLREGYALRPCGYPLFAVVFFLTGILGIVLAAKPVWMRDWLIAARSKPGVRLASGIPFAVAALLFAAALASILFCNA